MHYSRRYRPRPRRSKNPDSSTIWIAVALVGAFLVGRRIFSGVQTAGGFLGPGTQKDGVTYYDEKDLPSVAFDPKTVLDKNPRFATEPLADRAYAIQKFGGKVVDPRPYPYTLAGLQAFLDASGVNRTWASAWELTRPNKADVAARYGYTLFLPPQVWWPKIAALALMQNRLREVVGEPIVIANCWRPKGYNEAVGGAPQGDHPDCDALDLYLKSQRSKWRACDWLYKLQQADPTLAISLGVYDSGGVLHAGLQSANGKRTWDYRFPKDQRVRITQASINKALGESGVA